MQINNPIREIIISAVEPTGDIVKEGRLWYDSTNKILFLRSGTTWREVTLNDALEGVIDRAINIDAGTY